MKYLSAILTIGLVAITTTAARSLFSARGEVDAVKESLKAPSAATTITLSPVSTISPASDISTASTVSTEISTTSTVSLASTLSAASTVSAFSTPSAKVNLAPGDPITTFENIHPRNASAVSDLQRRYTRTITVWQFTGDICNGPGKKTLIAGGQFGDPAWQYCYPLDDETTLIWLEEVEGCVVTSAQESCSIPLNFDTWMTPGLCSSIEIMGRTHTMLWYRCDGM